MKTIRTLCMLLMATMAAWAQPGPNDMYIDGYVLNSNGQAAANQQVCVSYISNNPSLPSDTLCTATNANGYFVFVIPNGSLSGPNVSFDVQTYDPCALLPLVQTVENMQGTVDQATLTFTICATGSGNCGVTFTASNDSTNGANGVWVFTANPSGNAPFTYNWWVDGISYNTQTVTHIFNGGIVGVYVTVTDADSCVAMYGDTLYLDGNQNACSATIEATTDSLGLTTFSAGSSGTPPFTYVWSNGQTTQSIMAELPGVYCVDVTDANGCVATICDTLEGNNTNCFADFWYQSSPSGPNSPLFVGDTVQFNFSGSASPFSGYQWTVTGPGVSISSIGQNALFSFPIAGTYQVCVEVNDSVNNCSDVHCENIIVLPIAGNCQAAFTWYEDSMMGIPLPVAVFSDQSAGAAYWYWDFGDNSFSTDQNPVHTYNVGGTYVVCLTIVSSDQSCQSTYCDTVMVGNPTTGGCNAAFTNSGLTPIGYTFTANAQNPNLNYFWEVDNVYVGDGYEAYVPGFTNGEHTVCLTVIDSFNNCSDTQCQTFTVGSSTCSGYITGQVYAGTSNQPVYNGVVYLITFDAITNQLAVVDSVLLDSGNYYFFGPLDCGEYLVKAAAYPASQYYAGHIPTYYGNSPFWAFAQTITVDQMNTQVSADVFLIAASNPGGPGFIGGDVTEGANKVDPGDPLSGMQVMLFNMNGAPITYTYTDANGSFGFADLAYGTYQVYVEVLGVATLPAIVSIGPDQPSFDEVHILVTDELITTGIAEFDYEGAVGQVYPNPVQENASIVFRFESSTRVNISIVDLAGRTVSTEVATVAAGENSVQLATDQLRSGLYFLTIADGNGTFRVTRKFTRAE